MKKIIIFEISVGREMLVKTVKRVKKLSKTVNIGQKIGQNGRKKWKKVKTVKNGQKTVKHGQK